MKKAILAEKVGMTEIWSDKGVLIPVTVLQAGPCIVTKVLTKEKEGYEAVQVGFKDVKEKLVNKPNAGQFKKAGCPVKKYLREFKFENASEYQLNQEIKADIFAVGDKVDVTGTSIGKGFQGTVKRWNFGRGPMAHGSKNHREPGSIGAGTTPSRVIKGKRMAGNMGNERVTITKLKLVKVDSENGLVLIKGSVPGCEGRLVTIVPTRTKWNA